MASMSYYLIDLGTVTAAIAFVLLVVHTSLLAFGHRAALMPARTAAVAGAGSGTQTVTIGRAHQVDTETPAGSTGQLFVWVSFIAVGVGMLVRAIIVGRGPWGNL